MTQSVDWMREAQNIHWFETPKQLLDDSNPPFYRWFPDGVTNACYNALDVHVANGRGNQAALIIDSPVTQHGRSYSYAELLDVVAHCAGAMAAQGVGMGDRVLIYMPMIAEAVIGMLACARLGAVHSVVFGGFASNELAVRIDDAAPKLILSASCGIEPNRVVAYKPLLDEAIDLAAHKPAACLLVQRPELLCEMIPGRDVEWSAALAKAEPHPCVPVPSNHPLYILYTSGTTGQPKGVVRDTAGGIVALKWSMKSIYNVEPGEVFWAASDVGWVVGHSYIVYGPLFAGNTTLLYEGKPVGTPDAGAFWRVIEQHKVSVLFTAPTAFRAIRKEDPDARLIHEYDLGSLKALFLAGERCDPDTLHWAEEQLSVPVIDHWWQTETGWPICANCLGIEALPVVPGSPARAVPGYDVVVLNEQGEPVSDDSIGALAIKLPLPPGNFTTLWNADERYEQAYFSRFPGYYETGDAGYIDDKGYVFVMARTDDVINVAGHRLSTGAMEEVLAAHHDVAECAVIGVHDALKGQLPLGLIVLSDGVSRSEDEIVSEVIASVRHSIGPVAAFKRCYVVRRLPKTRSGKILRATMRSIADGESFKLPATIDDPAILDEIAALIGVQA
ncbi:propionyl-CoA synthetase [Congregibacter sp.]|uniref:propionyl-CoA synthetase n=1 Tax=Congregibacter sp. TaxID=2744308 RepID=UPI003F6B45A6